MIPFSCNQAHREISNVDWPMKLDRNAQRVKEILGIPKDKRLLSIISIGFPAESPSKTRKELGEIMFTDRYGRK